MQALARRRTEIVPDRLAAVSGFSRYKKESRQEIRKPDVQQDPVLKQLVEVWCKWKFDTNNYSSRDHYQKACRLIKNVSYSAKDVEKFSVAMGQFQAEEYLRAKAGFLLSALINCGKDKDYKIHTTHGIEIDCIGYENTKNIEIIGDVGNDLGWFMKSGKIVVSGNAGSYVGCWMEGGTIKIHGNSRGEEGNNMLDGEIIINGSAGDRIGHDMRRGSIVVKGKFGREVGHYMHGGEIYLRGRVFSWVSLGEYPGNGGIYFNEIKVLGNGRIIHNYLERK